MGTKHTPGPWGVESTIYSHMAATVAAVEPGRERSIAQVWEHPRAMADARLIAAAPELFEALRECQAALAMMIAPDAIKQTTVINAFAAATAAEAKAREALAKAGAA